MRHKKNSDAAVMAEIEHEERFSKIIVEALVLEPPKERFISVLVKEYNRTRRELERYKNKVNGHTRTSSNASGRLDSMAFAIGQYARIRYKLNGIGRDQIEAVLADKELQETMEQIV